MSVVVSCLDPNFFHVWQTPSGYIETHRGYNGVQKWLIRLDDSHVSKERPVGHNHEKKDPRVGTLKFLSSVLLEIPLFEFINFCLKMRKPLFNTGSESIIIRISVHGTYPLNHHGSKLSCKAKRPSKVSVCFFIVYCCHKILRVSSLRA